MWEPIRTWVFMVLDVVSLTETHQSPIRIKTHKGGGVTRPPVPGTTCPRKPSVSGPCLVGRSTNRVAVRRCAYARLNANPFVAHGRGDSVPPTCGRKSRGRKRLIKSDGCEPTPFPAHPYPRVYTALRKGTIDIKRHLIAHDVETGAMKGSNLWLRVLS